MGVGAARSTRLRHDAARIRALDPLLDGQKEAIGSCLAQYSPEFGGIKVGIVHLLPNAEEFNRVLVAKPLLDQRQPVFNAPHHISKRNVVLRVNGDNIDFRFAYFDLSHVIGLSIYFRFVPVFHSIAG